jgi:hypothetical protein
MADKKVLSTSQAKAKLERGGGKVPSNPTPNTQGESGNVTYPMPDANSEPQRPTHTPGS